MRNIDKYTDEERSIFVELAAEIGIGRSIRELGYPSYPTAQAWCRARGVTPNKDTAYAQMKEWHTFYQVEDLLIVGDEMISAIQDRIIDPNLTPDEVKKLSESYQKVVNTRLLLEGKATNINESRSVSKEDSEFEQALREFRGQPAISPGVKPLDDIDMDDALVNNNDSIESSENRD